MFDERKKKGKNKEIIMITSFCYDDTFVSFHAQTVTAPADPAYAYRQ